MTGLPASATVVLQNNGGDDLSLNADGPFTFATRLAPGSSYAVTVLTAPTGQTCTVANGSGTVSSSVSDVQVTCSSVSFTVGGTVTGLPASATVVLQNNGGDDLSVGADGPFTFATRVAAGSTYAVTVRTSPTGRTCTVANGSGTASSSVSDVQVTCAAATFTIGGTVTGLPASATVVLQNNGGDDLSLSANGPFTFATRLATGSAYAVTVRTAPTGASCTVKGSGTVGDAPVDTVGVVCAANAAISATVLQRWTSPASWGPAWPDEVSMVQHAHFSAATLVENGHGGVGWAWRGSFAGAPATEPVPLAFDGFPGGVRFAGGPFALEGQRYQASGGDAGLDLAGDMLVCAIVQPYFDPEHDGNELPIIAKGRASNPENIAHGGWVLAQSHESFLFAYQVMDSAGNAACPAVTPTCGDPASACNHKAIAYSPTHSASGDGLSSTLVPNYTPPLDTSYVVVCGGRDGNTLRLAINAVDDTLNERNLSAAVSADCPGRTPGALDADTAHRATIGGYSVSSASQGWAGANHPFPGRVYETAVWNLPATVANLEAKLAAVQGLTGVRMAAPAADTLASYTRNREGPYTSVSGAYHSTWRHSPRLDPTKGQLFGLQGWNRVSFWMPGDAVHAAVVFAAGEDLKLWTPNGGAEIHGSTVKVPGDSVNTAQLVTLPAGASISLALDQPFDNPNCAANDTGCAPAGWPASSPFGPRRHSELTYDIWDAAGPIQGQLWVRLPSASTGTLRVRYQQTTPDPTNKYDIDLAKLSASAWKRVYLSGTSSDVGPGGALAAADTTTRGTLFLENPGSSSISFYAWGVDLTQIGGGGESAFATVDPGPAMYDWSAAIDSPGKNGAGTVTELTRTTLDALQLVGIPTDPAGFCLSADAQPATGLDWSATMRNRRTLVAWRDAASSTASLYASGTAQATHPRQLCFELTGSMTGLACAPAPAAWTAGSLHNVKGCVSATGQVRLYDGDTNTQLATAAATGALPGLSNGHLLVGNAQNQPDLTAKSPWHGYVSRALLCHDGDPNACQ